MQMVQHGARGAAAQAVRAVAVERVLADVEVEGREVGGAEVVQIRVDAGPVVARRRRRGCGASSSVSRCSTQRSSSGISAVGHALGVGRSRPGCPAASAACCAGGGRAPPAASGSPGRCAGPRWCRMFITHRRRMSAPYLSHHLLRRGDVAERLRHLPALLVQDEAVRQHRLERGDAAGADRFQQRRLEPAAMLVRAFQIEVRRAGQVALAPARRRGWSRFRTRHRRCPSPARSRPGCGHCRGSATAAPG